MQKPIKYFLAFLFVFYCNSSFAQTNLVPNPSFELYDTCPNTVTQISFALNWYNPTTYSPDYFNTCSPTTTWGYGVPDNSYGNQIARTDSAYAGIIFAFLGFNGREYIQTQLVDSLDTGIQYYLEFYVCYSDSSNFATNDVGAYFSNTPVFGSNNQVLPYTPQINNNSLTNPLATKNIWIKVFGSFFAIGGEKYITIGNFKNDLTTDTTNTNDGALWCQYSYYYIDDVFLTHYDSLNTVENYSYLQSTKIFPNPVKEFLSIQNIEKKILYLDLYDISGRQVISVTPEKYEPTFKMDLSNFNNGVYFIQITYSDNQISNYKIILNK